MENNITIAVIGGTGKAGSFVVRKLLSKGYHIRILVREPAKLNPGSPLAEKVQGDVLRYEDIDNLIRGCSAVISTLGQRRGEAPVFSAAAENIIRAMDAQGVGRYIVLTGLSIDAKHDKKSLANKMKSLLMKVLFGQVIRDKQNEFRLLSESDLSWTVVRVPFIEISDDRRGVELSLSDCGGKTISTADLAVFLAEQINDERYIGKAPFIWSPAK